MYINTSLENAIIHPYPFQLFHAFQQQLPQDLFDQCCLEAFAEAVLVLELLHLDHVPCQGTLIALLRGPATERNPLWCFSSR